MCRKPVRVSSFSCGTSVSDIFVSSPVSLTLFQVPFLVRAKVSQSHIGTQASVHPGWGICAPPPHQGQAGAGWHSQFVFVYSLPLAAASFHSLSLWVGKAALICLCYEISLKHCAFHSVSTCLPWRSQKIFLICCLARLPPTPPFCLWVGFP